MKRVPAEVAGTEPWQTLFASVNTAYFDFESKRKVAERALELSSGELIKASRNLQDVLEALPDVLFEVSGDDRLLPITQRELPGLGHVSVKDYFTRDASIFVAARFHEALDNVRRRRVPDSFEFEDTRHCDALYFEVRLVPHGEHGAIGMLRDITARRKAEISLQLSEQGARQAEIRLRQIKHDLETEREKLRILATFDSLTCIWNRRSATEYLSTEYSRSVSGRYPLSVVLFDLDHFKLINDTYGHMAGDCVLEHFARRLRLSMRDTERAARYGGEEFLLVVSYATRDSVIQRAESIRAAFGAEPVETEAGLIAPTCSAGVAWKGEMDRDAFDMIRRADLALYRAKATGRNRILAEDQLDEMAPSEPSLVSLREALLVNR